MTYYRELKAKDSSEPSQFWTVEDLFFRYYINEDRMLYFAMESWQTALYAKDRGKKANEKQLRALIVRILGAKTFEVKTT